MQFKSILLALLFSTQGLASPMPEGTENSLVARSCYGAKAGCNTMPSGACDDAADKLVDDKEYHTQGSRGDSGESHMYSGFATGCGVFLQEVNDGTKCSASGSDMKSARDKMVSNGCGKCGRVQLNDDCYVAANYVTVH